MKQLKTSISILILLILSLGIEQDSFAQEADANVYTAVEETTIGCDQKKQEPDSNGVYTLVEEMPMYPGGISAMMKFLSKEIVYPKEMVKAGTEMRIYLSFVVEADGSISNIKPVRPNDPNDPFIKEGIRVLGKMPKWIPGKQKGKAVRVAFNLPIRYALGSKKADKNKK